MKELVAVLIVNRYRYRSMLTSPFIVELNLQSTARTVRPDYRQRCKINMLTIP